MGKPSRAVFVERAAGAVVFFRARRGFSVEKRAAVASQYTSRPGALARRASSAISDGWREPIDLPGHLRLGNFRCRTGVLGKTARKERVRSDRRAKGTARRVGLPCQPAHVEIATRQKG
ncbi:hypothetical protein MRX96_043401 [Rhipicephalus microplus]